MTDVQQKTLDLLARLTKLTEDRALHWEADPMRDCVLRARLGDRHVVVYGLPAGAAFSLLGGNQTKILQLSTVWRDNAYAHEALRLLYRTAQDEAKDTAGSLDAVLAAMEEL